MTAEQKARVYARLFAAGVSGEDMTRANERLAVIEAATVHAQQASSSGGGG